MGLAVIVIGAGVGGLTAAAGLARNGHSVTVLERANSTTDVGFAFRITPNSDRCLKHLEIDAVAGGAVKADRSRFYSNTGKLYAEFVERDDAADPRKGVSVFAFRPQLQRQLVQKCLTLGVNVLNGAKVDAVDTENVSVTLADGKQLSADLIVAADGINSVVRSQIVDAAQFRPRATTKHNAFRFVLSTSAIKEDEMLSSVFEGDVNFASWREDNKRILVYPVDFGKQFNVVCTHPEELSTNVILQEDGRSEQAATYDHKVSLDKVLNMYAEFEPRVRQLFKLADPEGFRAWPLCDLDELPRWSLGHTVLIGDAAHAVLPFGFSGASMAIEDAIMLSELLPGNISRNDLPGRLQLLEQLRKPRVKEVRERSREIGRDLEHPAFIVQYNEFLADYNAVEAARVALDAEVDA